MRCRTPTDHRLPVELDYRQFTIAVYREWKRIIVYDRTGRRVVSAAILYREDQPVPWSVLWSPEAGIMPASSPTWREACRPIVERIEDPEARRWVGRVLGA